MERQAVIIVALALLATLALAADKQPKDGLPSLAPVPSSTPDSNRVGTSDSAPAAGGPSDFYDAIAAGVGGPVSEKAFGTALPPNKAAGAMTPQVSTVAALAAVVAASFF